MRKAILILVIVVLLLLAVPIVSILRHGVSARTAPTATEEAIARTMRHLAIPSGARSMRNPVPLT